MHPFASVIISVAVCAPAVPKVWAGFWVLSVLLSSNVHFHFEGLPVDLSVNWFALVRHVAGETATAVGFGFTVIVFVVVSEQPLPLEAMSVTV